MLRGRRLPANGEQLPLVNALVLGRRVEFESGRVAGQVDRNAVVGVDGQSASAHPAEPRNMHLLGRQRNIVVAGMLDDGVANILSRARAVGRLQGFVLDPSLKLSAPDERG